jgi:transposase
VAFCRIGIEAGRASEGIAGLSAAMQGLVAAGPLSQWLVDALTAANLPVICVENRQVYQALKLLATHKTDHNDARGLAHLARTGFFKPVRAKSLPAHAVRSLSIARKNLVGQRVTLENQIRGLPVVFGVRLPSALSPAFVDQGRRDRSCWLPYLTLSVSGFSGAPL